MDNAACHLDCTAATWPMNSTAVCALCCRTARRAGGEAACGRWAGASGEFGGWAGQLGRSGPATHRHNQAAPLGSGPLEQPQRRAAGGSINVRSAAGSTGLLCSRCERAAAPLMQCKWHVLASQQIHSTVRQQLKLYALACNVRFIQPKPVKLAAARGGASWTCTRLAALSQCKLTFACMRAS